MILAIDAGNSRVKWRLETPGGVTAASGAAPWRETGPEAALADAWAGLAPPARVVASNVAGDDMAQAIAGLARDRWGIEAEFCRVDYTALGVRNGYRDPRELGIDRWLGVLAAWHRVHGAAVVIDCGTATTCNVIGPEGEFRGGHIAPGVGLMRRALAGNTAQLYEPGDGAAEWPARSTREALLLGPLEAATGAIERALARLARDSGGTPACLLTGGEAALLAPRIGTPCSLVPDLVLEGVLLHARAGA